MGASTSPDSVNPNFGGRIDWSLLEKKRQAEEKQAIAAAIGQLKSSVALLHDLEKTAGWAHICTLLRNTAAAKQLEAMKASDPTSLARAFGYMAACNDTINLPNTLAVQLQSQLDNLSS